MFYDWYTMCEPHLQKVIYVYNYANKTIFKHRRICKMCTANMCAHYMYSINYMHSFLIGKFDLEYIEYKFLIFPLFTLNVKLGIKGIYWNLQYWQIFIWASYLWHKTMKKMCYRNFNVMMIWYFQYEVKLLSIKFS
jgi:hypothetical protein